MINHEQILSKINTPFYLFDKLGFIKNYNNLRHEMRNIYSNYNISYSYKTNYTPYICKLVKDLGGLAEVVSDMEYTLAKKIGYSNDQIVYNGPDKGSFLEEHLYNDGILNIDSVAEAKRIEAFAKQINKKLSVGIRINLDITKDFTSRFGIDPNSSELNEVLTTLRNADIRLSGLHCHISRCRSLDAWAKRAQIMAGLAKDLIIGKPDYISLGSGMYADMPPELKAQFNDVPTYADYASTTLTPFQTQFPEHEPILLTEPGTTLVARYISFVTSVVSVKNIKNRRIATVNGSYQNLGEICTLKTLPIKVIRNSPSIDDKIKAVDIMGYTCLEQDLMYPSYLGEVATGDNIIFENVGGYSIVSKPQFIHPNCPMYSIEENGKLLEIMRAETFNDVFDKFLF